MSKRYTVGEIQSVSREFVYSLDRTVLGSFAVHPELLVLADSIQRIDMQHENIDAEDLAADLDDMARLLGDELYRTKGFKAFGTLPEVCHWWIGYGDRKMSRHAKFLLKRSMLIVAELESRLTLIAAHPDMHDFFVADIWDICSIRSFIAGGVDVELAVTLTA